MSDQFDRAQELDALAIESARADQERKAAKAAKLTPGGHCLNPACEEPFTDSARLFCNPNCGAEFQRRRK